MLRVGGGYRDRRRRDVEVEGRPSQAAQLGLAQAGRDGDVVEQGALGARHAATVRTDASRVQQPPDLRGGEGHARLALAPGERTQVSEGRLARASRADHPAAELLRRGEVAVARGDAVRLRIPPPGGQLPRDPVGVDVGPVSKAASIEEALHAPSGLRGVTAAHIRALLGGVAVGDGLLETPDELGEGSAAGGSLPVDEAELLDALAVVRGHRLDPSHELRIRRLLGSLARREALELASELLSAGLVPESSDPPVLARSISELDIPALGRSRRAAAIRVGLLEHSHRRRPPRARSHSARGGQSEEFQSTSSATLQSLRRPIRCGLGKRSERSSLWIIDGLTLRSRAAPWASTLMGWMRSSGEAAS